MSPLYFPRRVRFFETSTRTLQKIEKRISIARPAAFERAPVVHLAVLTPQPRPYALSGEYAYASAVPLNRSHTLSVRFSQSTRFTEPLAQLA